MVNNAPEKVDAPGMGADLGLMICNDERRWGRCAFFFPRGMFFFPSRKTASSILPGTAAPSPALQDSGTSKVDSGALAALGSPAIGKWMLC